MIIPVSSKYGEGAKASFFANVIPAAESLCAGDDFALSRLISSYNKHQQNSKHAVYQTAFDACDVDICGKTAYEAIRQIAKTPEMEHSIVADAIAKLRSAITDPRIIEQLPLSLTSACSRIVADQLNKCARSIDVIKQALAGKGFWQVNLNITKWQKGIVDFATLTSDSIDIRIIGSKSAISDFEAKHGTLNYLITKRK